MGIDLRGADIGVPKKVLDDPEIGPVLQQMGGEAMSEHMWGDVSPDPSHPGSCFDASPERYRSKTSSAPIKENRPGRFGANQPRS